MHVFSFQEVHLPESGMRMVVTANKEHAAIRTA